MIWFSCKQCGKTHGRPETAIGATIFCDCGQGLLVPWESTASEPPPALEAEVVAPPPPQLEPVTFDVVPSETPAPAQPRTRKRGRLSRRDPAYCFNHEEVARKSICGDCGESFCDECLVEFQGAGLCGPCKNYRVKNLQRSLPPSNLSILGLLVALLTGPCAVCMLTSGQTGFPWWNFVALLPQAAAVVLAILALRDADQEAKSSGPALALTALATAATSSVLICLLAIYAPHGWS